MPNERTRSQPPAHAGPAHAGLVVGVLAMAAVGAFAGGAGAYGAAQAAWGRPGAGVAPAGQTLVDLFSVINAIQLLTMLVAIFVLVYLRPDRIPVPYATIPVLWLGLVFASGSLESVGRHVLSAFPNAWLLAGRRARWFRFGWPVLSGGLLFVLSTAMFAGRFVP